MCCMAFFLIVVDSLCTVRSAVNTRARQGHSEACGSQRGVRVAARRGGHSEACGPQRGVRVAARRASAPGSEQVRDPRKRRRVGRVEAPDTLSRVVVLRWDRQVERDDIELVEVPQVAVAVAQKPAAESGTVRSEGARGCEA